MVAFVNSGEIANCYNAGTVIGRSRIGGLASSIFTGTVTNCYYLDTSCTNGVGNIYSDDVEISAEAKTSEQFASGEVAYLLQGEQTEEIWGQKLGTDTYPALGGEKVYAVKNSEGEITGYKNAGEDGTDTDKLKGHSISLGDRIAVNYYMSLTEKTANDENARMEFVVPDGSNTDPNATKNVTVYAKDLEPENGSYVFTCEVAAKEMTSEISAKLVTSETELILENYTVKEYAEEILRLGGCEISGSAPDPEFERAVPLVKSMLNFGTQAQLYFNYKVNNLANNTSYMTLEEKAAQPFGFSPVEGSYTLTGSQEGVSYYGTALDLESQTQFKHYFKVDESIVDVNELEINCIYPTALKKNGSFYEITINGIPVHQMMSFKMEVSFGGVTLDYTLNSYGARAMASEDNALYLTVSALAHFSYEAHVYSIKED